MAQAKPVKKKASAKERRTAERRTTHTTRSSDEERRATERRTKKPPAKKSPAKKPPAQPDPDCKKALRLALEAAEAAAEALGIDPDESPMVKELRQLEKEIPDGEDAAIKKAFIEDMNRRKKIADDEAKLAN